MDSQSGASEAGAPAPTGPPDWPRQEGWHPPAAWPPPPPAPGAAPDVGVAATDRTRRWPVVALVVTAILIGSVGVGAGAAAATSSAASRAAQLAASGDFAGAIALDRAIEGRTGPIFIIDSSAAPTAAKAERQTVFAWARSLGRQGRIDEAVSLYRALQSTSLRKEATEALAALLYGTAAAAASRSAYPSAIVRLQQVIALAPGTADGTQARKQLPIDQAGEAQQLLTAGHGADAVAMLDTVVEEGSAAATTTAQSIYPEALLVTGQEDVAEQSYKEAASVLQRLVNHFAGTPQAAQAQAMLGAPVMVAGTLVDKNGIPMADAVRLSTNYKAEPGGTYKTSGPFYYSSADAAGDFVFKSIPVGGPYVLEVFANNQWTTLVDPTSGQPAHPVKVTALVPVALTFVVLPT